MMSGLHPKCVVVPVDFSDESMAAVDKALSISGDATKVRVLHVLGEMHAADPGVIWQTIDDGVRKRHAIQALTERFGEREIEGLSIDVEVGDPGHRIAGFAERVVADLIVIPSHGRTGLSHMLIGSVAERVVRLSHCPVLVLRK